MNVMAITSGEGFPSEPFSEPVEPAASNSSGASVRRGSAHEASNFTVLGTPDAVDIRMADVPRSAQFAEPLRGAHHLTCSMTWSSILGVQGNLFHGGFGVAVFTHPVAQAFEGRDKGRQRLFNRCCGGPVGADRKGIRRPPPPFCVSCRKSYAVVVVVLWTDDFVVQRVLQTGKGALNPRMRVHAAEGPFPFPTGSKPRLLISESRIARPGSPP